MTTAAQHLRALQRAKAAGDEEAVEFIRAQAVAAQQSEDRAAYEPTPEGVGGFAAGWGKTLTDMNLGAGQLLGAISPNYAAVREPMQQALEQQAADKREIDAPLMATTRGKAGAITSGIANALPLAFAPGANTMLGATAMGALSGAVQPAVSGTERLQNTGAGAAIAPAAMLGGRALSAAWRGGKAVLEPFTRGGQERVAARTLQAYAGGPQRAQDAAAAIARNGADVLPGYQPTTAELAENAGLAQLERTIRNNPEALSAMTERTGANKDAVLGAINSVAGDDAALAAATATRQAAGNRLYEPLKRAVVDADADLGKLLARPSMGKAWERAQALAAEANEQIPATLNTNQIDGRTLHWLKMGMDDLADDPVSAGLSGQMTRSVRDTRNALVQWIERKIPDYQVAREAYRDLSKPINQMEVGRALRDRFQPALADYGATSRSRAASFADAMRSGDAVAARALGRGTAKIDQVLEPAQMQRLEQAARMLGRRANAEDLGRSVGSNTAQNLASQNVLRQIVGPLGLPSSTMERAAGSTVAQTMMRPYQFVAGLGEPRIMDTLAQAALDPKVAERLLRQGVSPQQLGLLRYQAALSLGAAGSRPYVGE